MANNTANGDSLMFHQELEAIAWPKNGELTELVLRLPNVEAKARLVEAGLPTIPVLFYATIQNPGSLHSMASFDALDAVCNSARIIALLKKADLEIDSAIANLPKPEAMSSLTRMGGLAIPKLRKYTEESRDMRKMFCAELILYDIYQKSLFSADVKVTPENLQAQSKNLRSIKPVDALAIARIHLDSTRQAIEQRDAMLAELMKTRRSTSSFGGKRGSGVHIPPWNAPSNTPRRYS